MIYAKTSNNNRINARNARRSEDYFCPICNSKLILRNGVIKTAHFAHGKNTQCVDDWRYDTSEFKLSWQNMFHDEEREVLVENSNGIKHIADIDTGDFVLEIQHDAISAGEFEERTTFFTSIGKRVVWLFDVTAEYEEDRLLIDEEKGSGTWKAPHRFIKKICSMNEDQKTFMSVFLQFSERQVGTRIEPQIIKLQKIVLNVEGVEFFFGAILNAKRFLEVSATNEDILVENNIEQKKKPESEEKPQVKGHSIMYLWKMNYRVAIFLNMKTGLKAKIFDDQAETALKSDDRKWRGMIQGKDYKGFSKKVMEIYGAEKDEWKVEWFVTHQDATY